MTTYPVAYVGQPFTANFWNEAAAISELMLNPPAGRCEQAAAQSMPDNTLTALTFTTEVYDTDNFHSTAVNTQRVTPTVAGYYLFRGLYYSVTMTTPVAIEASFRKNGATQLASGIRHTGGSITNSALAECMVEMNGTTDYVELMGLQDSSGAVNTAVSLRFTSFIEWRWMQPL